MPKLFVSEGVAARHAGVFERLSSVCADGPISLIQLPGEGPLPDETVDQLDAAFISTDLIRGDDMRRFFGAVRRAPAIRWVHIGWAGTDAPVIQELMDRGVPVSNSSGVTSEPIALSVIGGMLSLHRGFPRWFANQQKRHWEQLGREAAPPDLRGQTLTVLGVGAIGQHIARMARVFGLHVVGVRRTPAGAAEHLDEWLPPERLNEVLPRTDWLAITIPLTAVTRNLVDAQALALLPRGAHILNVARGAIIDEAAMVEALRSGHIAGAYLDVFATEPLPADSPLWEMSNVIVSPHDSSPSKGNEGRAEAIFLEELERWVQGQPPSRLVTER